MNEIRSFSRRVIKSICRVLKRPEHPLKGINIPEMVNCDQYCLTPLAHIAYSKTPHAVACTSHPEIT